MLFKSSTLLERMGQCIQSLYLDWNPAINFLLAFGTGSTHWRTISAAHEVRTGQENVGHIILMADFTDHTISQFQIFLYYSFSVVLMREDIELLQYKSIIRLQKNTTFQSKRTHHLEYPTSLVYGSFQFKAKVKIICWVFHTSLNKSSHIIFSEFP